MDTRSKIRGLEELLAELKSEDAGPWTLALGRFPALTAEHVAALQAARTKGSRLAVAVAADDWDGPHPFDAPSRAQLVAGLAAVDCVVICDQSALERLRSEAQPARFVDVEAQVRRDFVADVISRHQPKP